MLTGKPLKTWYRELRHQEFASGQTTGGGDNFYMRALSSRLKSETISLPHQLAISIEAHCMGQKLNHRTTFLSCYLKTLPLPLK